MMSDERPLIYKLSDRVMSVLCCRAGCPKFTASACAQETGDIVGQCACLCHTAWQMLDEAVEEYGKVSKP
jgi:hypothetical protein